jgi:predicted  nucleic acid-binding Zn-ribbon protein
MSPDLERLIKLQQLNTTIDEARRLVAAHPQRLAEADARLSEAQQRVESAKERLKESNEARRALEKDVAVYQGRLTKFKDQLLEAKTNQVYQALQHEISTAQNDLGGVEEKVLERMLEADGITADIKQAEAALAAQQKEVNAEKTTLGKEIAALEVSLAEALTARGELLSKMEQRLIAMFDQVARFRKGVALAEATRDGLCSACHVRLRPQVFQLVRQNDSIIQCDQCQRILYYVPPPVKAESSTASASQG